VLKRRWGRVFVSALQNIKARQQTLPAHAGDHGALLPTEGAVVTCVRRPSCPQRAQIHIKPDFTPDRQLYRLHRLATTTAPDRHRGFLITFIHVDGRRRPPYLARRRLARSGPPGPPPV